MIYKYFQTNKRHYKILRAILDNENPSQTNLNLKKKIKKFNEYQHFSLFCNVCLEIAIYPFTKENLSHFTKKRKKTDNEVDLFFPRSNFNTSASGKDYFIILNGKKDLRNIVDYYLHTKEYPRETLINKLLVLKENIIKHFMNPLKLIIPTYEMRLTNSNNLFRENNTFMYDLIEELEDIEEKSSSLINEIDNKINSFSREKTGNYQLTIHEEILKQIYVGLDKHDLIDIDKTTPEQFIDVWKKDWKKHNSTIYFKMNNIDFKYFINSLGNHFNSEIPLTFIEYANNIQNKNGYIKSNSVISAYSKSKKNSKNFEIIDEIFKSIKKG